MRAHALVLQRWAGGGCRGDVLGQQVVHAVRAQTTAARVREQGLLRELMWFFHPGSEDRPSVLAQRRTSLLASLADHAHVRAGPQMQVLLLKARQLRQTYPSLHRYHNDGVLAPPRPYAF